MEEYIRQRLSSLNTIKHLNEDFQKAAEPLVLIQRRCQTLARGPTVARQASLSWPAGLGFGLGLVIAPISFLPTANKTHEEEEDDIKVSVGLDSVPGWNLGSGLESGDLIWSWICGTDCSGAHAPSGRSDGGERADVCGQR